MQDLQPTTVEPETHWIRAHALEELDRRLANVARRSAKLGFAPIRRELVGERFDPVKNRCGQPTGQVEHLLEVRLVGEAPRVDGHVFVARLEHTEAGNFVSRAPGASEEDVPARYRTAKALCEHCNTVRPRRDTFVLRAPDGALRQIGRNCLADYLRGTDPAAILRLWSLIDNLLVGLYDDDEGGGGGGGGRYLYNVERLVAAAFHDVHTNGWRSRREEGTSTADMALFACGSEPSKGSESWAAWNAAQPTAEDHEEARTAIAWAQGLAGDSDYEHNLKLACSLDVVTYRQVGILASVTVAYLRHLEREFARKRDRERGAASTHFGEVGKSYVRPVVVTKVRELDGEWGLKTLVVMEDREGGHLYNWWATGAVEVEIGDVRWVAFRVKRHETYRDTDQTVVTHARLHDTPERPSVAKWIGPSGEVFKTKKALLAAAAAPAQEREQVAAPEEEPCDPFAAFDAA